MASQAGYCAAKAGMDHFTRCLALDEALHANGAKVCSLAPGVIDTDMQVQMRGSAGEAFPDQSKFLQLKAQGQLSSRGVSGPIEVFATQSARPTQLARPSCLPGAGLLGSARLR
jgi:NAD(P)-dependent dehydrogenase (short-subunit alcohol dehydrogenase family)